MSQRKFNLHVSDTFTLNIKELFCKGYLIYKEVFELFSKVFGLFFLGKMWLHITKGKLIHTPLSSNSVQNSDAKLSIKSFSWLKYNISSVITFLPNTSNVSQKTHNTFFTAVLILYMSLYKHIAPYIMEMRKIVLSCILLSCIEDA